MRPWAKHTVGDTSIPYGILISVLTRGADSDIVHLQTFGQHFVVLNSHRKAITLLEERSQIYSDRPRLLVAGELALHARGAGLVPFGPRFRAHRRNFHKTIGTKSSVGRFEALQEREVHKFLVRVLAKPEDLEQNIVL